MIWWFVAMHVLGGLYAWLWRNQNENLFYALLLKTKDLDKLVELSKTDYRTLTIRQYFKQCAIYDQVLKDEKKLRKKAAVIGLIWTALRTALPPVMIVLDIIFLRHIHKKYTQYEGMI
ncbi:hypothetical protein [Terribacillus saccharophilus]|uniref:Uncharacterized protein n=1 Tax=Terribacillus saccharophilus TaxID=361277 RepID=A0ABX4GTC5_9BACI|nr:hypothetical protein [Terribacillus saccharophilus]PAD94373.1 hypothetical protein CHH50_18815 [Terribacillus saccharophilus]PAD98121.1 hypothetical protein CHH48_18930 [Terribacillus saccharophilus]